MEDPDQSGFHHLHLRGPNPAEIFAWYQSTFGGELVKWKDMLDAIRYGTTWLLIQDSQGETMAPTRGRSIDHLGWSFPDLDATAVALKAKGVNFTLGPVPYRDIKIAFIEGPGGVRIELVESP
jgi:catechol 2,3-dioxygenase-like lactoylglutathione lyase family enzyme